MGIIIKEKIMNRIIIILLVGSFLVFGIFCAGMSNKQKGAAVGGASGAVIGGAIGKAAGNTAVGAILGAAIGGAAGIYIGNYMDEQAEEMREELQGAKIERVGEGIKITFDSGILFEVDKSELSAQSKQELSDLADILKEYEETNILIEGHTDATGSDDYNMALSKRRAESVAVFLSGLGVQSNRFDMVGYGENQPVASNETERGRQLNRRVEVAVFANKELKEKAKEAT